MGPLKKILIIDEDEVSANRLLKALDCAEFEVIKARNILNSVYAVTNAFFDLVIADGRTMLRFRKDGFDLLKVILNNCPDSRLVVMLGKELEERDRSQIGVDALVCFDKPVDLPRLKQHLQELGMYSRE